MFKRFQISISGNLTSFRDLRYEISKWSNSIFIYFKIEYFYQLFPFEILDNVFDVVCNMHEQEQLYKFQ